MDYSADSGVWVFETLHWSRYAMDDSEDEEDEAKGDSGGDAGGRGVRNPGASATKLMPPPAPLGPAGRIPRASRTGAPTGSSRGTD